MQYFGSEQIDRKQRREINDSESILAYHQQVLYRINRYYIYIEVFCFNVNIYLIENL